MSKIIKTTVRRGRIMLPKGTVIYVEEGTYEKYRKRGTLGEVEGVAVLQELEAPAPVAEEPAAPVAEEPEPVEVLKPEPKPTKGEEPEPAPAEEG